MTRELAPDEPGTPRTVRVETARPYDVVVGAGSLARIGDHLADADRVVVLADRAAWEPHGPSAEALAGAPALVVEGGEDAKTLERLGDVLDFLARSGCSRRSVLVAFGGGTVGDLGGLAASLFKRGMDVVQAPTTLLAQVDASVGGKTAINLAAGKNLAGTFHQPRAVVADTRTLATLDARELRSGLGEVVKTALIGGPEHLARLESSVDALAAGDADALGGAVADCVSVKARVVASDPDERGPRRALNLGHTFGHAIEHAAGYGAVPHGEAVAVGIALALEASAREGLLADGDLGARYARLCDALGLPRDLAALRARGAPLDPEALVAGLAHDKKGAVGAPEFVLVRGAGDLALGVPLDDGALSKLLA